MSNQEHTDDAPDRDRRRLLGALLAILGSASTAGAWYATRPDESPPPAATATTTTSTATTSATQTTTDAGDDVPAVVARYAPNLYFGRLEKWYPTDPRPYVVETSEGRVVDGFTALEQYATAARNADRPPNPIVCYNIVEAAPGIDAVQYWLYSVFDQFTVNFHWHDWELLQVFVDRATGTPLLLSASAHARSVPNNEYRDPDLSGGRRPGILAEVGSHSSASELNDRTPSFERLSATNWTADVTNDPFGITGSLEAPFAYGLPRDEGFHLPFVMPELDDVPLSDHPDLAIDADDFIDGSTTVGSWHGLPTPPSDLPVRDPGLVLTHPDSDVSADATYDLVPMQAIRDAVDDFVGPALSFEFTVPGFVEDFAASHLTAVGTPWEQPRFTDPLADVTDPAHHQHVDGETPGGLTDRVSGRFRLIQSGLDGALDTVGEGAIDALDGIAGVSLYPLPVELAIRLASPTPTATTTRGGTFGYLHVAAGDHHLVANGPGYAPLATRFEHEGGHHRVGDDGDLAVVATEDAAWIRGDGRSANGISHVHVTETYAGVVYDGQPAQRDRFAIAVHRDGTYTVDILDSQGRAGAYTVGPDDFGADGSAVIEAIESGKASLTTALLREVERLLDLARTLAERDAAQGQVLERLSAARDDADHAIATADRGDPDVTDDALTAVLDHLTAASELLEREGHDGYRAPSVAALLPRVQSARDRTELALETPFTG